MIPKALWLKEEDREVWNKAATICEYQDFINLKLTGRLCASSCNCAARWHWDGQAAIESQQLGRPLELLRKLGMAELAEKWPSECLAMGAQVGGLTESAAAHLGLRQGTPKEKFQKSHQRTRDFRNEPHDDPRSPADAACRAQG